MVKKIYLIILLILTGLVLPIRGMSQGCPKGVRYNCVYGCGRHTDNNGDGFCDYSFITVPEKQDPPKMTVPDSPAVKTVDTLTVANPSEVNTKEKEKHHSEGDGDAHQKQFRHHGGDQQLPTSTGTITAPPDTTQPRGVVVTPPLVSQFVPGHHEPVYDLIFVSAITLGLYFTTLLLYRRKVITRIHHRKFWNMMLLLTFLVSCLFGFFLVIQINYDVAMKAYKTLLYWHVEIGIAMTLVAVIHILWHLTYFKNMVSKKW